MSKASPHILAPKMFRFLFFSVPFLVLVLVLGGFFLFAQRPESPPQPNQAIKPIEVPPARQVPQGQRIREGTAFKDMHVFFRQAGDRTVLWTVEENKRFECHNNLALERILTAMQEKPERQFWKIEGVFTEFRGENSVFIRRAVVALPPATNAPVSP